MSNNVVFYPVHAAAGATPPMDHETRSRTKKSILENGIQRECVLWTNPTTHKTWLMDGRSRQEILKELLHEGHTVTTVTNQPLILPTCSLPDGTSEGDAIKFVEQETLQRKQLSKSQVAMTVVILHEAQYEARCKAKEDGYSRKDIGDKPFPGRAATEGAAGDFASQLAAEYSTNRQYIIWAHQLNGSDKCSDLVTEVMQGSRSLQDGFKEYKIRVDGTQKKAVTEEFSFQSETDALGKKIPAHLKEAFDVRPLGVSIMDAIGNITTKVNKFSQSKGGMNLDFASVDAVLSKIKAAVRKSLPHSPCTACKGSGTEPGTDKRCKPCGGGGFITDGKYKTSNLKSRGKIAANARGKAGKAGKDKAEAAAEGEPAEVAAEGGAEE